jgi:hypothetical protein
MAKCELELKSCAFCGSNNIKIVRSPSVRAYAFYCNNCQAMVSFSNTNAKQCADKWNRRSYVKGTRTHEVETNV